MHLGLQCAPTMKYIYKIYWELKRQICMSQKGIDKLIKKSFEDYDGWMLCFLCICRLPNLIIFEYNLINYCGTYGKYIAVCRMT